MMRSLLQLPVGLSGLEPLTPALSAQCSNRLSYRPLLNCSQRQPSRHCSLTPLHFPASRRFHNRRLTLHFSQLDIAGAGLPCGSHPAFRTSGALTAEEWQDNFLRSNFFFGCPLCL